MGLYSGGLVVGRIFASEIWGAYFWEGLFFGELIIRILCYIKGPWLCINCFQTSEENQMK